MANALQSVAYPISSPEAGRWGGVSVFPKSKKKQANSKRLSREDMEIVAALEAVKSDMDFLHNCFDHTTDAILVDSLIYELKAANLKYKYYLNLCKEKGIVGGVDLL
ncbi:MAG: YaaL family protein [Defluviitaleaceae bacterium]|nr:YaaL family protein [Defluviitaleaceae bacterium]